MYFVKAFPSASSDTYQVVAEIIIDDHADMFDDATNFSIPFDIDGTIGLPDDEDVFSFTARFGTVYRFVATPRDQYFTQADTRVFIHDAQGTIIRAGQSFDWSPPADGTYFLKVAGHDGSIGGYSLRVEEQQYVDDYGNLPEQAISSANRSRRAN